MRDKTPLSTQIIAYSRKQKRQPSHWRAKNKEIPPMVGITLLFLVTLITYLATRDPTIVTIWTGLTALVVAYFSRKK